MDTKTVISSNVERCEFSFETGEEDGLPVFTAWDDITDGAEREKIATQVKASPELLDAIASNFRSLCDSIHEDLVDLYKRQDR